MPILLRVGLLREPYLLAVLVVDVLDGLEETGYHFLAVLPLYLRVVLDLLHEQPGEGGGEVLDVALQVSDAVDRGRPHLRRREMCDEDEFVVDVPA